MRTVARLLTAQHISPTDRKRRRGGVARVMASVIGAMLLLVSANPSLVYAAPPPEVGIYTELGNNYGCELAALFGSTVSGGAAGAAVGSIIPVAGSGIGGVVGGAIGLATGFFLARGCDQETAKILDHVHSSFWYAYDAVEKQGASPGKPDNYVHRWAGVLIQDFKEGTDSSGAQRGDGWGAIIGEIDRDAYFVGGGFAVAYKRAVNDPNVVGTDLYPGYPINEEHVWPGSSIRIQNFENGTWGDSAIIGTDSEAWIVAGGHWTAYWQHNGQIDLRNPLGSLYIDNDGWYTQDFEGGRIRELHGDIKVELNTESAVGGETPNELPAAGRADQTSPPIEPSGPAGDSALAPAAPPTDNNSGQTLLDQGQPAATDSNAATCVDGASPVVTRFSTHDDTYAWNLGTEAYFTIEIENRGCETWDPGNIEVHDDTTGETVYHKQQAVVEPGAVLVIDSYTIFDTVGTHTMYITSDNGGVLVDESGSEATLDYRVEDLGAQERNTEVLLGIRQQHVVPRSLVAA